MYLPTVGAQGVPNLIEAARASRLVIFAGAGISMAPPTDLPSWRDFNRSVVRALATAAVPVLTRELADRAAAIVLARHDQKKLPPEYQAQVLADLLHHDYFAVLQHLDSDRPNATHLAIAWLARLGCVRAVVTTNFDRTLEAAFSAVGVPNTVCYRTEHFAALAGDLGQLDSERGHCFLLKLHGSVDDPSTLIDTLAQRKRGLALPLLDCVRALLRSAHWLFLGYSGLDLEADRNYLLLRHEAERAAGLTWFVRENTAALDSVVQLKELYGARFEFAVGELPEWLVGFTGSISAEPNAWIARWPSDSRALKPLERMPLDDVTATWAARLSPQRCALALSFVVMACAEPQTAADVASQLLEHTETDPAYTSASLLKAVAANAYGLLIAALGRHAEALRWLEYSVDTATRAGDPDSADRMRSNLAVSLEALGRVADARNAYDVALAGYRERGEPRVLAHGLINLASHSIRQGRFDQARVFAEEAVGCAIRAGDELARATALFDLGKVARLTGDAAGALEKFAELEPLFVRLGNDHAVAALAGERAEVLSQLGRFDEAERSELDALRDNERLGGLTNRASGLIGLGTIATKRADLDRARHWFEAARDAYRSLADPVNEAVAVLRIAETQLATGAAAQAAALAREALPLVAGRSDLVSSSLHNVIGKASLACGDVRRAEQAYQQLRELALATGDRRSLAAATTNLATVCLLEQRDGEAVGLFAAGSSLWSELGERESLEYCALGERAVRLDQRVAALSDAGHRARTSDERDAAAGEMLELYPELIAMYEQVGASTLAALFCESAGSTARVTGALDASSRWYLNAADRFRALGRTDRERAALERAEQLLRHWTNALIENGEFARVLPDVLALADVAARLDHAEMCASSSLNAGIIIAQTSQDFTHAKNLAERALQLLPADSSDIIAARTLLAHCTESLRRSER